MVVGFGDAPGATAGIAASTNRNGQAPPGSSTRMEGLGRHAETIVDIGTFTLLMLPVVAASLFMAGAARLVRHR